MAETTKTQTEALYTIAEMNGYNGPKSGTALMAFFNSSDALKAKARAIGVALNRGGMIKKYNAGGVIPVMSQYNFPELGNEGTPSLNPIDGRGMPIGRFPELGNEEYKPVPMPIDIKGVKGPDLSKSKSTNFAPNYDDFLKSDFYKNTRGKIAAAVIDPVTIDGQTYNFSNPLVGQAYRDYMASLRSPAPQAPPQNATPGSNQQRTGPVPIVNPNNSNFIPLPDNPTFTQQLGQQTQDLISQTMQPYQSEVAMIQPEEGQFVDPTAGQVGAMAPQAATTVMPSTSVASMPTVTQAATVDPTTATGAVQAQTAATQAAQGQVSQQAQIQAAQQGATSLSGMQTAQGTALMMNNPVQREIQSGELVSGVANAEKAAEFTEQVEAAQATPSKQATVAGQLDMLMADFEGGETPAWAAGSMRTAMQTLAARGLGASSMAGQAVVQAAMESAIPIAQADASIMAQFESQNLTNRQQRAMLAAQQRATFMGMEFDQAFQARVANSARIGDIANMNFTAEQQIALENARAANTVNLSNLSNSQAMVMAEAAALSQLDMANLNNRQQTAVQNAQNFLQMDMANLSNEQQTAMFKAQQNIQSLFTDQAAQNAAAQFNATSENQTDQFFASLGTQVSQFNSSQQNAMSQFNVSNLNALRQFNAELQQQRDMFNAQNGLVVAQANAQWRQNLATINTAAANESNMQAAKTLNAFTATNLDAYWQRERDIMSFAFTSAENAADRLSATLLQKMSAADKAKLADEMGKGSLTATLLKGGLNYLGGKLTGNFGIF